MGEPLNSQTPTVESMRVGVIGVGVISQEYFDSLPSLPGLQLVAVADLDEELASTVAAAQGTVAMTVDELLASPDVDVVLNLTIPSAHIDIDCRTLAAGKHVYTEKPLALAPDEARAMLSLADVKGLRVGSAPDTVLGTGVQTARQILDSGAIGHPLGASAFWVSSGHERWHPAPQFYYQPGGGPLFDMGPYYLTSLVTLLGPVVNVTGTTHRSSRQRTILTGPNVGATIPVDVDTHVTALLKHRSGVTSTITVSFEVWATRAPLLEVYGTLGTIGVPDPNTFAGDTEIFTQADPAWVVAPVSGGYANAGRGVGLADMAQAIHSGTPHRASGALAFHVLEIMDAIIRAASAETFIPLDSTIERPDPVRLGSKPEDSSTAS